MNTSKNNKPNKKWYTPTKLLSYNKMVNFVMSHRGGGKTYSCKQLAIKRYLNKGEQFMYIRRYQTELVNVEQFFDDVKDNWSGVEFKVKGNTFIINGQIAGYAVALTQQTQIRSTPYPNVTLIIFDEFCLDESGPLHYLKNEVNVFLEVISTVCRSRDNLTVICCANSISYVNPYFTYWKINIDPLDKKEFYLAKNNQVIVQLFDSEIFYQDMLQTKFGQLIDGTEYGEYAMKNEVLLDNQEFIMENKPKDATFSFAIKYRNKVYSFWYSNDFEAYYVNHQYNPKSKHIYAITNEEQTANIKNIKVFKKSPVFKTLKEYYNYGMVYYVDQEHKKGVYSAFKTINV